MTDNEERESPIVNRIVFCCHSESGAYWSNHHSATLELETMAVMREDLWHYGC